MPLCAHPERACYGCDEREIKFLTIGTIPGAAARLVALEQSGRRVPSKPTPYPEDRENRYGGPSIRIVRSRRRVDPTAQKSSRRKQPRIGEKFPVSLATTPPPTTLWHRCFHPLVDRPFLFFTNSDRPAMHGFDYIWKLRAPR